MEKSCDDKKRLKSIVSALQKSVECPVCLGTVKHPFKACVRGQSVCFDCVEKCPLCQEELTLENLACLSSVLEALPKLCRYSDAGCEEVVEPGNDHEMFCGFRPIVCRAEGCSVKMPLIKFLDHHKSQHPNKLIINETKFIFKGPLYSMLTDIPHFKLTDTTENVYIPVSLFNNLFWILGVYDVTEEQFNIVFQATPIGRLEHDNYVCLKFKKEEFVYTYTLKAQVMSSCGEISVVKDDTLDNKYCMKIPRKEMLNFTNGEGEIELSYNFFEKKISRI